MKLIENHVTTPTTVEEYRKIYVKALRLGIAFERTSQKGQRVGWNTRQWEDYMRKWPNICYSKTFGCNDIMVRGNSTIGDEYIIISPTQFLSRMEGEIPPKGTISLIHKLI